MRKAESKGAYEKTKEYVWGKYGFNVSTLYIAQIKRKCELEVGEHYNKLKKDNPVVLKCLNISRKTDKELHARCAAGQ